MHPNKVFELSFSLYGLLVLAMLHLGAILIIRVIGLPWWVKLLLVIMVIINFVHISSRQIFRSTKKAIINLKTCTQNTWLLQNREGVFISAVLRGESICTLYF